MTWAADRRRILQRVADIKRRHDEVIERGLVAQAVLHFGRAPSCPLCLGPYYCCRMLVTVTLVDALVIAEHLAMLSDTALEARLREQAERQLACARQDAWFDRDEMCAFKGPSGCSIYSIRPLPCRTHHAWTDPSWCDGHVGKKLITTSPGAPVQVEVLVQAWRVEQQILGLQRRVPYLGLLPDAVLLGLDAIRSCTPHRFVRVLTEATTLEKKEDGHLAPLGTVEQTP